MQKHALVLLNAVDEAEKFDQLGREMRRTVGEFGWEKFVSLFPEYLPTGDDTVSTLTEEDVDRALDSEGPVNYDLSESVALSPEEGEALLAQLMADASSGRINGEQALYGDWQ